MRVTTTKISKERNSLKKAFSKPFIAPHTISRRIMTSKILMYVIVANLE
jgi:hypothetical protein